MRAGIQKRSSKVQTPNGTLILVLSKKLADELNLILCSCDQVTISGLNCYLNIDVLSYFTCKYLVEMITVRSYKMFILFGTTCTVAWLLYYRDQYFSRLSHGRKKKFVQGIFHFDKAMYFFVNCLSSVICLAYSYRNRNVVLLCFNLMALYPVESK